MFRVTTFLANAGLFEFIKSPLPHITSFLGVARVGHFSSATDLVSQLRMASALPSRLPLALSSMPAAQVSAADFTARMSTGGNTSPGSHCLPGMTASPR